GAVGGATGAAVGAGVVSGASGSNRWPKLTIGRACLQAALNTRPGYVPSYCTTKSSKSRIASIKSATRVSNSRRRDARVAIRPLGELRNLSEGRDGCRQLSDLRRRDSARRGIRVACSHRRHVADLRGLVQEQLIPQTFDR